MQISSSLLAVHLCLSLLWLLVGLCSQCQSDQAVLSESTLANVPARHTSSRCAAQAYTVGSEGSCQARSRTGSEQNAKSPSLLRSSLRRTYPERFARARDSFGQTDSGEAGVRIIIMSSILGQSRILRGNECPKNIADRRLHSQRACQADDIRSSCSQADFSRIEENPAACTVFGTVNNRPCQQASHKYYEGLQPSQISVFAVLAHQRAVAIAFVQCLTRKMFSGGLEE